jgi:hypothetical protein
MDALVLDVDAYGSRGQLTLMADYFELCCKTRPLPLTHKVIVDYLIDRKIRIAKFATVPLDLSDASDATELEDDDASDHMSVTDARRQKAHEDATRIFELIRERQRYLGELYPYILHDGLTIIRRDEALLPYDVAVTQALRHAFLSDTDAPHDFERFVAACFASTNWTVFHLAAEIRATPGSKAKRFGRVFKKLIPMLSVRKDVPRVVPEHVHDHGADIVTRLPPIDDRPGCRTVIVQVTVGRDPTWKGKAADPPIAAWSDLLGDPLAPHVVVALPHHVERDQLHELVREGHGATYFDRLRLLAHAPNLPKTDFHVAESVYAAGVEW